MKIVITTVRKPRNPFVVLARQRHAGRHQPPSGASRQTAVTQLRRELQQFAQPQRSP